MKLPKFGNKSTEAWIATINQKFLVFSQITERKNPAAERTRKLYATDSRKPGLSPRFAITPPPLRKIPGA